MVVMAQDKKDLLQKLEDSEARINVLEAEAKLVTDKLVKKEFEAGELRKNLRLTETELAIYREIDSITLAKLDIKAMLERIMDMVVKTMDTDAGTLYRLDDNGELVFDIVKGPVADKLRGEKMKVCEGIAGWIARTGMPYVANEVANDPLWKREYSDKAGYTPQDILGVPLKTKKGVIGVIEVLNKKRMNPLRKGI